MLSVLKENECLLYYSDIRALHPCTLKILTDNA